jgi:hypothetical protein
VNMFWTGAPEPAWLGRTDQPLFVSHSRLMTRKTFPRALGPWALDSGAFTQLNRGAWTTRTRDPWSITVPEYAAAIERYQTEIGNLAWAAPMDLPCETEVVWKNGIGLLEHQRRTIANYLDLRDRVDISIPVLQGWELDDYLRHIDDYAAAGIDLAKEPLVGIGSICRRGQDAAIKRVIGEVSSRGIRIHAFGVRGTALRACADIIASADSMSWSSHARRQKIQLPGHTHGNCASCLEYALQFRETLLDSIPLRLEAPCVA